MSFLYKTPRLSFRSGLLFLLFLITSCPQQALALTGEVVSIADGDAYDVKLAKNSLKASGSLYGKQ